MEKGYGKEVKNKTKQGKECVESAGVGRGVTLWIPASLRRWIWAETWERWGNESGRPVRENFRPKQGPVQRPGGGSWLRNSEEDGVWAGAEWGGWRWRTWGGGRETRGSLEIPSISEILLFTEWKIISISGISKHGHSRSKHRNSTFHFGFINKLHWPRRVLCFNLHMQYFKNINNSLRNTCLSYKNLKVPQRTTSL